MKRKMILGTLQHLIALLVDLLCLFSYLILFKNTRIRRVERGEMLAWQEVQKETQIEVEEARSVGFLASFCRWHRRFENLKT